MKLANAMVLSLALLAAAPGCDTGEEPPPPAPAPAGPGACFCVDPWSGATRCCIAMPDFGTCNASVSECNAWFMTNTACDAIGGYRTCATR